MKRLLLVLIAGLVVSGVDLPAQNVTPRDKSGDRALLFGINGFGDFGVSGVGVGTTTTIVLGVPIETGLPGAGFRLYLVDRVALRAGVGFRTFGTKSDDTLAADTSVTSFGIGPGIEFHMINAGPVSGYVGAAIGFSSNSVKVEGKIAGNAFESTQSMSSFGVSGILGVEFFPWSNISLGAEYNLAFNSASRSSKSVVGSTTTETDLPGVTTIGIGSAAVFLGVYF